MTRKSFLDKIKSQKFIVFVIYLATQTWILWMFKSSQWCWPLTVAVALPAIVAIAFYAARALQYFAAAIKDIKKNIPNPGNLVGILTKGGDDGQEEE